jgi:hypothetical protein
MEIVLEQASLCRNRTVGNGVNVFMKEMQNDGCSWPFVGVTLRGDRDHFSHCIEVVGRASYQKYEWLIETLVPTVSHNILEFCARVLA